MALSSDHQRSQTLGPWPTGLNNWADPSDIHPNQLSEAIDIDVGTDGHIRKRPAVYNHSTPPPDGPDSGLTQRYIPFMVPASNIGLNLPNNERLILCLSERETEGDPLTKLRLIVVNRAEKINNFFPRRPFNRFGIPNDDRSGIEITVKHETGKRVASPVVASRSNCCYIACNGHVLVNINTNQTNNDPDLGQSGGLHLFGPTETWTAPTINKNAETLPTSIPAHMNGSKKGWIPPSRTLAIYNFGAGEWLVSGGGDRIRWSYPLSTDGKKGFQNFRAIDVIRFPLDAQDEITALQQTGQNLLVFTKRTIWILTGGSPYNWLPQLVSKRHGTDDQASTVQAGAYGIAFWETDTNSVWIYNEQTGLTDIWRNTIKTQHQNRSTETDLTYPILEYLEGNLHVATNETYQGKKLVYVTNLQSGGIAKWALDGVWLFTSSVEGQKYVLAITEGRSAKREDIRQLNFHDGTTNVYPTHQSILIDDQQRTAEQKAVNAKGQDILYNVQTFQPTHEPPTYSDGTRGFLYTNYASLYGRINQPTMLWAGKRIRGNYDPPEYPDGRQNWKRAAIESRSLEDVDNEAGYSGMWELDGEIVGSKQQPTHDPRQPTGRRFPAKKGTSEQGIIASPRRQAREARLIIEQETPTKQAIKRIIHRYTPGVRSV